MLTDTERDPLVAFALRWWWLLAIGVVLGAFGAIAYTQFGPTSYTSTALVQVPAQTGTDPTANAAQARSATANYAAAGSSTRMYDLVVQALKGKLDITANDLQLMEQSGALSIKPQRSANFFGVTVIDKDPQRAELLANTFAQVMVQNAADATKTQFDARQAQLQQQIDYTRQQLTTAQLFQNQKELQDQLTTYRSTLLALQSSREQDLARVAAAGASETTKSSVQDLLDQQITDVTNNIKDTTTKLTAVQDQINALPPGADPLLSASFAAAYSQQLADLTTQSVGEQLAAMTAAPPLVQYGDATDAVSTASLKKLGLMGVVLGGALFAGLAFLFEFAKGRRAQTREDAAQELSRARIDDLLRTLEEQEITNAPVRSTSTTHNGASS